MNFALKMFCGLKYLICIETQCDRHQYGWHQLVEHEIGGLWVASSSPALGTGRMDHTSTQWQNEYLAF